MKVLSLGLVALFTLSGGILRAEDKDVVGFWKEMIREKGVPGWVKSGILQVELRDGKLTLEDVDFAATRRNLAGPKALINAKAPGASWTFRGLYELGPLDFRLKRVAPGVYEGVAVRGMASLPFRLEKIASEAELIREYRTVIRELELEIATSEMLIPLLRDRVAELRARAQIDDWARRLRLDRSSGIVDGIVRIYAVGDLGKEQVRLVQLGQKLKQAQRALKLLEERAKEKP